MRVIFLLIVSLLMLACSDGEPPYLPAQLWGTSEIVIETRPAPVRPGMNEFLVIASESNRLPIDNMVVSLRMSANEPWQQAIQDGGTGVYRKAILVRPASQNVFVRLLRDGEVTVLSFPLFP